MEKDELLPVIEAFLEDQGHLPQTVVSAMMFGDKVRISRLRAGRRLHRSTRAKAVAFILENASEALRRRLRHETLLGGYHILTLEADATDVEESDGDKARRERRPDGGGRS